MQILAAYVLALVPALLLQQPAPSPVDAAWDAAAALKKQAAYDKAAQAFEALAAAHPTSPRAPAARVEAGVCWFSDGRGAQELHRNTPKARASFDKALVVLDGVLAEHPTAVVASRAAYMQGSTHLFAGELELSEAAYASVLDAFPVDPSYVSKALERRAFVRRHLLRPADATLDYQAWLKKFGAPPDTVEQVKQELKFAATLGRAPLPIKAQMWLTGEPVEFAQPTGDVIGLYFFATWCDKCEKELPFVLDLERRLAPQGLRLVGIVDHSKGQTPDSVRKYLGERAIRFPTLINDGSASVSYGVDTLPHLVLIDREGLVRWRDNPANLAEWTLSRLLAIEDQAEGKK